MDAAQVEGYCRYIFAQKELNFSAWWNSEDPDLKRKPRVLASMSPMLVVDRAEQIVEFEKESAAA